MQLERNTEMLEELIISQRTILSMFWDTLSPDQLDACLEVFASCRGSLVFSGVGKSGLVGKKIAYTLNSIGVRATYLSPTDALHGDIGIVSHDDVVVLLSNRGESSELLQLIPFIRNRDARSVSWTSAPESRLARAVNLPITLPALPELCPFNMVPTTSALGQLAFGDLIIVALLKQQKLSLAQYAANHPGGRIGRRLIMRVSDLMLPHSHAPLANSTDLLSKAITALSEGRCGALLVTDPTGHLEGLFTDGDLRRALQAFGAEALSLPLCQVMTRDPRVTSEDVLACDALASMEEDQQHPITVLPVVDADHRIVGILRLHDLLQAGI